MRLFPEIQLVYYLVFLLGTWLFTCPHSSKLKHKKTNNERNYRKEFLANHWIIEVTDLSFVFLGLLEHFCRRRNEWNEKVFSIQLHHRLLVSLISVYIVRIVVSAIKKIQLMIHNLVSSIGFRLDEFIKNKLSISEDTVVISSLVDMSGNMNQELKTKLPSSD